MFKRTAEPSRYPERVLLARHACLVGESLGFVQPTDGGECVGEVSGAPLLIGLILGCSAPVGTVYS